MDIVHSGHRNDTVNDDLVYTIAISCKHSLAIVPHLQCVTSLVQQWLSISVPLVVWRGNAKGSTAQSEFCTFLNPLWFRVDSNVWLTLPVYRQAWSRRRQIKTHIGKLSIALNSFEAMLQICNHNKRSRTWFIYVQHLHFHPFTEHAVKKLVIHAAHIELGFLRSDCQVCLSSTRHLEIGKGWMII